MFANDCHLYSDIYHDPASNPLSVVSFAIIYSLIFLMGFLGNATLIFVTVQHKTLQTVQNIFILNLAASDIIMCLFLPVTPVTNIYKNWFFGALFCRLIPSVQAVSVFICTFSLGAIAIDRYVLVVRPHTRPLTRSGAIIITVILWILSVLATLPYAVFMHIESYPGVCGEFCTEKWPNASSRRAYTLMVMIAQFVIPFAVMTFCYASIFARLRFRARVRLQRINARSIAIEHSSTVATATTAVKKASRTNFPMARFMPNNGRLIESRSDEVKRDSQCSQQRTLCSNDKERQRVLQRTRRTTVILVSMVVIFGLTWLPHNIASLMIEYDAELLQFLTVDDNLSYVINLFTHSIAMTNNVANPVLYAWLNPTFRDLVIQTCFKERRKRNTCER
ncbi:hypothetical protein AB6A40_006931 [Gnathostoma spinigerum]|uniref:G-protein coupled receptors family 1 profile domain-containing protein n=1 Tax=Gnathostoma spinigerum TaxID=75299 RepID=A0ABD6EU56_9BILA